MSFTNFTTGEMHSFGGKYLEFVENKRLRYTDQFDDPNLYGQMQTTVEFKDTPMGTELTIVQAGIPDPIPEAACYLGWQESLSLLTLLVEPEIPHPDRERAPVARCLPLDQVITVGASRPVRFLISAISSATAIRSASAACVSMLWRAASGS